MRTLNHTSYDNTHTVATTFNKDAKMKLKDFLLFGVGTLSSLDLTVWNVSYAAARNDDATVKRRECRTCQNVCHFCKRWSTFCSQRTCCLKTRPLHSSISCCCFIIHRRMAHFTCWLKWYWNMMESQAEVPSWNEFFQLQILLVEMLLVLYCL